MRPCQANILLKSLLTNMSTKFVVCIPWILLRLQKVTSLRCSWWWSFFPHSPSPMLNSSTFFNRKKFCRMEKRLTTSYVRLRADWWSGRKWFRTQPEGKLFVNKIVEYPIRCHWCTTTWTEKEKHKAGEFSTFSCWKRSIHGGVKLSEVVRFDGKLVANFSRWKFQTLQSIDSR